MRRASASHEVTAAAIDSFEASLLGQVRTDAQRQQRHALFREWKYPSMRPTYDDLRVDAYGNVWLRHFAIGSEHGSWSVFDRSGRWLGVVEMPAALEVKEIGSDYVVGVTRDALDVEYVEVYALVKKGA